MRTAIEALFDAMITEGWAKESSGDVEAPTGYFARISNSWAELPEVLAAFADVTDVYGTPEHADIVGHFLVVTDSQGFLSIATFPSEAALIAAYRAMESEYDKWVIDSDTYADELSERCAQLSGPADPPAGYFNA